MSVACSGTSCRRAPLVWRTVVACRLTLTLICRHAALEGALPVCIGIINLPAVA